MDMRRPLSGSSSLAAVEELTPPGGSYPSRRSSPVRQPRPTTAILTNRLAERSQALSSPSSVVVPAKRSASPSPTVAQAWKKPFTDHSVSQPVATAKSSPKVKRESSAALDMPPTSSRRVSGSSAETGKRADGDCALASRVDGVPAVKVELASSLSLMDAVPADPPRSAMSQSSSAACAGSPQSDVAAHATDASPSVAGSASTGASAESTVSTVSAAKSRKDRRKANEAKHKEGLDGGEAAHSRAPKAGLKAAAAQERMNAEQGKFDLGLVTPVSTFFSWCVPLIDSASADMAFACVRLCSPGSHVLERCRASRPRSGQEGPCVDRRRHAHQPYQVCKIWCVCLCEPSVSSAATCSADFRCSSPVRPTVDPVPSR